MATPVRQSDAIGNSGTACRVLLLQTIRTNRLHELRAVCARLRERAPGCVVTAVVTSEVQGPVAASGCAEELLLSTGGGRLGLARKVRDGAFDEACIVTDGDGAPGQIRNDLLALAARPRTLLWCTPEGAMRRLSRPRLALRVAGELVLAGLALGAGAVVGLVVACALTITSVLGCARMRQRP